MFLRSFDFEMHEQFEVITRNLLHLIPQYLRFEHLDFLDHLLGEIAEWEYFYINEVLASIEFIRLLREVEFD